MAQLRQDYQKFIEAGVEILVIGPEDRKAFAEYWKENDLPYPGIPDPKHKVLKRYGQEVNLFKFGRMPAQVLVDREGIARFVHYGNSMSDIPETTEILRLVKKLK